MRLMQHIMRLICEADECIMRLIFVRLMQHIMRLIYEVNTTYLVFDVIYDIDSRQHIIILIHHIITLMLMMLMLHIMMLPDATYHDVDATYGIDATCHDLMQHIIVAVKSLKQVQYLFSGPLGPPTSFRFILIIVF